jgi:hypothetical protein
MVRNLDISGQGRGLAKQKGEKRRSNLVRENEKR